MGAGGLSEKEADILRQLLHEKGIFHYAVFETVGHGKELPGSTYFYEIESMTGTVITTTHFYYFYLDWVDGNYTFGIWHEIFPEQASYFEKELEIQQKLREVIQAYVSLPSLHERAKPELST